MTLPVASEKSGKERSGIDGREIDGIDGIVGNISRVDFVMLSILLGAVSSARTVKNVKLAASNPASTELGRIEAP
jgi:hypothetical protein